MTAVVHYTRRALMARLSACQNNIDEIDMMTITGLMTDEQLAAHVERYESDPRVTTKAHLSD